MSWPTAGVTLEKKRPMTDSNATRPVFRTLSAEDSRAFLATQHVARIAYTFHDRVDIEPIHYVADGDWLYGRTSPGAKLSTLAHHPWCAVEVDEVHGVFDWTSVVVKGAFYILDETRAADAYARGLALLRGLVPAALLEDDPVADRTVLFRIHIAEITGRSARSA
jgi:nitroimidazol reductase NimA-like FMN-containing flavoprotein (pyridoxamine 5'-phosphate oxidase superfamily)